MGGPPERPWLSAGCRRNSAHPLPLPLPRCRRDEGGATGRSLQPGADAELASPEAAAAAGVVLAACKELQEAAVGLFDSRLTRFAISDAQVWWAWGGVRGVR